MDPAEPKPGFLSGRGLKAGPALEIYQYIQNSSPYWSGDCELGFLEHGPLLLCHVLETRAPEDTQKQGYNLPSKLSPQPRGRWGGHSSSAQPSLRRVSTFAAVLVCARIQGMHVEGRGQAEGVSSLLPLVGSRD